MFKYLLDKGYTQGLKMVGSMTGKVTVKEVLYEKVGNGAVVVYKIEDYNKLPFGDFYIATFDDTASESVWGAGFTPKTALSSASLEWDKEFGGSNPFREVLGILKEENN